MMPEKTFLLVEDDRDDTELFNEAIESLGSAVKFYSATDGREALDRLNAKHIHSPDIIFLDINMPQMNGWQVLSSLKGNQSLRNIPVIMYSTSSQPKDIRQATASGALCFFTKPNSFLHLKKVLEVVITYLQRDALDKVCEAVHSLDWRKS